MYGHVFCTDVTGSAQPWPPLSLLVREEQGLGWSSREVQTPDPQDVHAPKQPEGCKLHWRLSLGHR